MEESSSSYCYFYINSQLYVSVVERHIVPKKYNFVQNSIFIFAVLIITLGFLSINYNTPIIGDLWAPRIFGQELSGLFLSVKGYYQGYFNGNPRIGQFWLIFSGYHPVGYAIVASFFGTVFILLLGVMVQGRNFLKARWMTLSSGLIAMAFLWFIDREIGPIFFYEATSGNYLFGTIMVLLLLLPFRVISSGNTAPFKLSQAIPLALYSIAALFAGMAHEIYGPAIIATLCLILAAQRLFFKIRPKLWQALGLIGYTIGYCLIFFAPGQDKRYTDSRYDGIPTNLDALISKLYLLADLLIANGLALGCVCLVVALARLPKFKKFLSEYMTIFVALMLAGGFVATAIAAPILGHRLAFASHTFSAIAFAVVLTRLIQNHYFYKTLMAVCCGYLVLEFFKTHSAYDLYKTQFNAQAAAVQKGLASGNKDIVAPGYSVRFHDLKKYVFPEFPQRGPKSRVNSFIARYYKIDSFNVVTPPSIVEFSKVFLGDGATIIADGDCDKNDDKAWVGPGDSFGSLVCGGRYVAKYDQNKSTWTVAGPKEVNGAVYSIIAASHDTVGAPPETGELRIWGGIYVFDDGGGVYSSRGQKFGHVKLDVNEDK